MGDAAVIIGFMLVLFGLGLYFYVGGLGGIIGSLSANRTIESARRREHVHSTAAVRADSLSSQPPASAGAGFSRPDILAAIDKKYSNDLTPIEIRVADLVPGLISRVSLERMGIAMADELATFKKIYNNKDDGMDRLIGDTQESYLRKIAAGALEDAVLTRTLTDFKDNERAVLRLTEILHALGEVSARERMEIFAPIVWNEGKCLVRSDVPGFRSGDRLEALRERLGKLLLGHFGETVASAERLQARLRAVLAQPGRVGEGDRAVLERYLFAGARWLAPDSSASSLAPQGTNSRTVLRLGAFEDGGDLLYDLPQSLTTIGMPGSGKSQTQVARNLLHYRGGAVVVDLKGELFDMTGGWRHAEVGPVQCFAPDRPEISATFNPLDWVRGDPIYAWDDAERLADLLVVKTKEAKDPYWEQRGLSLVTTALSYTAIAAPPEQRNMSHVLNQLYAISEDEDRQKWAAALAETGVEQLRLEAKAFRDMPQNQREGVFENARTQLRVWISPAIKAISHTSSINTLGLRTGATLYLCVRDEDLERYATVLRPLIGLSMRDLMFGGPDREAPVVTFFIDEAPRLGRMDILESMIDIGRGYGLRVWLLAQNIGQFRERYKNADGMIGNCMVRCYMNPDEEDAQRLSRLLNEREGLLDGRRKALVEPWQLSGPEYADKIIAFIAKNHPARLTKVMPQDDLVCSGRIGWPLGQAEKDGVLLTILPTSRSQAGVQN
ncbi:type IV secretory system conjugative DNA transfer family protein (plasmid) [Xanthobacter dioxanivorans]|uniref:Type IV secretory system conjugative DNA transfer family protein n=1 Tax=Xanthobacter dioxanivorans TaxID=2528964 RepID=A0A974SMB6_9HYPH|nr:type IV secretory system conjugative DNA transfer family protein [Xanthobacter dioxanivorans]QRG10299.1 type IV secretory system conjugative DNA transfer family protein [Xanthobacter dioxanivorans]